MKIIITTDHAGIEHSQKLSQFLQSLGHECEYAGPKEFDANDDYPDFIFPAIKRLAAGDFDRAIIMGGSGQGEAIAANRIHGVRCALFYGTAKAISAIDASGQMADDEYEILRLSRRHNNANALSFAARFLRPEDMQQAAKIWLETSFEGEERHSRRIAKLDEVNKWQ